MKEYNFTQPSREFRQPDRQPADPEVVRLFEEHANESLELSAEFREILARIDFAAIRNLYAEVARQTDVDPGKMNFVGPDRILELDDPAGPTGQYGVDINRIEINYGSIKRIAAGNKDTEAVLVFDTLMHEEGHAVSKNKCVGKITPKQFNPEFVQSGYSQDVFPYHQDGEQISAFGMFEEGVTEKLSRQLGRKYIDTQPDLASAEARQGLREYYENDSKAKTYDLAVSFVEAFIARLSHESGVLEETVWGAIIRGKFEGADLSDTDFAVLFSEMFGDKFLERLADINSADEELRLVRLMDIDKLKDINPQLRERVNKRIDAFSAYERRTRAA